METNSIIVYIGIIILIFILLKICIKPIKKILKIGLNSIIGISIIYFINIIGEVFNFRLGINIWNAILYGSLGIPGVVLLILLKIFIL